RRVDESQEFQWLREDIKRFKKQKDEKTISLNEAQRLAEKKADDAREAERKKARAARKPDGLSFAEITLEQIESGKPPVTSTSTVALQADDAQEAGAADYRRAPPPPDFVLDEAADIVADMVARGDGTASRASTAGRKLAP
ncbi:MAG: carboxy terminal-processing peptidase, partial [Elusimicrobia bacterium]|nr:carboxy terminal-processing peptidase [Elusimicrobiota bacterium]